MHFTHEVVQVSMEKFIDTIVDWSFMLPEETVNCCQHIQDLKAIGNSQ